MDEYCLTEASQNLVSVQVPDLPQTGAVQQLIEIGDDDSQHNEDDHDLLAAWGQPVVQKTQSSERVRPKITLKDYSKYTLRQRQKSSQRRVYQQQNITNYYMDGDANAAVVGMPLKNSSVDFRVVESYMQGMHERTKTQPNIEEDSPGSRHRLSTKQDYRRAENSQTKIRLKQNLSQTLYLNNAKKNPFKHMNAKSLLMNYTFTNEVSQQSPAPWQHAYNSQLQNNLVQISEQNRRLRYMTQSVQKYRSNLISEKQAQEESLLQRNLNLEKGIKIKKILYQSLKEKIKATKPTNSSLAESQLVAPKTHKQSQRQLDQSPEAPRKHAYQRIDAAAAKKTAYGSAEFNIQGVSVNSGLKASFENLTAKQQPQLSQEDKKKHYKRSSLYFVNLLDRGGQFNQINQMLMQHIKKGRFIQEQGSKVVSNIINKRRNLSMQNVLTDNPRGERSMMIQQEMNYLN